MRPARSNAPRSCSRPMPGCRTRPLPRALAWAARPSTAPSAASWRVISTRPCTRSPAPGPPASSPPRRKRCWSRPPAPARPRAGRAGPSNCSPARSCASPSTTASRARRCAGAWPRTRSNPGARRYGISRETVRRRLAENALKPWREKMWCVPKIDGAYVARMENVLDLYAEPRDPKYPVVCLYESPVQLIGEVRSPLRLRPGRVGRFDYEYRRAGTVNLFVLVDAHRPWRKVTVTQQRTALDFARCMRELVEVDHPQA